MNFKSLDFFRKLPKDMDNSTVAGGVFSILAIIVKLIFLNIHFFIDRSASFFIRIIIIS